MHTLPVSYRSGKVRLRNPAGGGCLGNLFPRWEGKGGGGDQLESKFYILNELSGG